MKCPKCRTDNKDGMKFCKKCGASLLSVDSKNDNQQNKKTKKWLVVLVVAIAAIIVAVCVSLILFIINGGDIKENKKNNKSSSESLSNYDITTTLDRDETTQPTSEERAINVVGNENGEYIQSQNIAIFDDKYIALENGSLVVHDNSSNVNKVIVNKNVNSFLTNGTSILFSQSTDSKNKVGDIEMPADCTINYISSSGTGKEELVNTYGYGDPISIQEGKLYYTEYKSDYKEYSYDSLALYAYDISSGDKRLIQSNVCTAIPAGDKIVYIDMDSSSSEKMNLKYYDTSNDKSTTIKSSNYFMDLKFCNSILFFSLEPFGTNQKELYYYDFASNDIKQAVSSNDSGYMSIEFCDEKHIFYSIHDSNKDKYTHYRLELDSGISQEIKGLNETQFFSVFANDEKAYYYNVNNNHFKIYQLSYDSKEVTGDSILWGGSVVLDVRDEIITIQDQNGNISRKEMDPDKWEHD